MVQSESHPVIRVALLREGAKLPIRATPGSTGFDLYACLEEGETGITVGTDPVLIPTGIAIEFLPSLDVQIRPRSGLSSRGDHGDARHHRQRLPRRDIRHHVHRRKPGASRSCGTVTGLPKWSWEFARTFQWRSQIISAIRTGAKVDTAPPATKQLSCERYTSRDVSSRLAHSLMEPS